MLRATCSSKLGCQPSAKTGLLGAPLKLQITVIRISATIAIH
jgi:hypothetical protein